MSRFDYHSVLRRKIVRLKRWKQHRVRYIRAIAYCEWARARPPCYLFAGRGV